MLSACWNCSFISALWKWNKQRENCKGQCYKATGCVDNTYRFTVSALVLLKFLPAKIKRSLPSLSWDKPHNSIFPFKDFLKRENGNVWIKLYMCMEIIFRSFVGRPSRKQKCSLSKVLLPVEKNIVLLIHIENLWCLFLYFYFKWK